MTSTVDPLVAADAVPVLDARRGTRARGGRAARGTAPLVGRAPGVDLLPQEVHVGRRERSAVHRAWLGVIVVAVAVALGVGAATATSMGAAGELRSTEAETAALLKQQGQYSEVRSSETQSSLLKAAQKVGGSTEVDWSTYLKSVQASLPSNVTISSVTVDSSSPIADFTQATGPLQGQRVATISIVASSPTLPSVPDWLDTVKSLKGYVDASVESVTLSSDTAATGYTVKMIIHVDQVAYDGRYSGKVQQ